MYEQICYQKQHKGMKNAYLAYNKEQKTASIQHIKMQGIVGTTVALLTSTLPPLPATLIQVVVGLMVIS